MTPIVTFTNNTITNSQLNYFEDKPESIAIDIIGFDESYYYKSNYNNPYKSQFSINRNNDVSNTFFESVKILVSKLFGSSSNNEQNQELSIYEKDYCDAV